MKVILMMAVTLDGKIAKYTDHPANWTSKADKKIFVAETNKAGVIIMGKTTYDTIGKPLPGRLNLVLDIKADTTKNIEGSLEFTKTQPMDLVKQLKERGFEKVILGGGATINGLFLKANLIDEIWLTVEPKIFGDGLNLFKGVETDLDLELIAVKKLSAHVLQIRYRVLK